jgi:hypothetical protein
MGRNYIWLGIILTVLLFFQIQIVEAAICNVGSSGGYWKLVDTISPNAWDGVYVDSTTNGENKYSVDWCGWINDKGKECEINCRGNSPSLGTSFVTDNNAKPCAPESAKIYRWICNDCKTAYEKKLKKCQQNEGEFLYWNNVTCTGYCEIEPLNRGPAMCPVP